MWGEDWMVSGEPSNDIIDNGGDDDEAFDDQGDEMAVMMMKY